MTDREKAIVMAYTGVTMLKDDKLQIFYKYVEKIMGRPIWTHEMVQLADEIKEKSRDDFLALCADENLNEWIPVVEGTPKDGELVLFSTRTNRVFEGRYFDDNTDHQWYSFRNDIFAWNNVVIAWMPLPKPYKAESEDKA